MINPFLETIINIVKVLLAIVPFVVLCFVCAKVNIVKTQRSKQFLMPVIAVLYSIFALIMMNKLNTWILRFIKNIPKWIMSLAGVEFLPAQLQEPIAIVGNYINNFLDSLNLTFWVFFITNALIIAVYLIVKKIAIMIMAKKVKKDGDIHTQVASHFYDFFVEKDVWCLKENYVQARSFLKFFYIIAVIFSCILTIASRWMYYDKWISSVFYPVFGIIILGEVYFYLDGITAREYTNDILGEDEDAYKVVNYSLLRKFLRSIFSDKLLSENTSINNALAYDVTTDDIVRELESDEDPKIATFASYIDVLNRTGFKIDHNYFYSSLDMLNGKSVLFNNPFYNDLIPYAFYPMNRTLLSHKKVLVVLGRHAIEDDIKEWLERGIESVTNIPFMWNIGVLTKEQQDLDIGIVTRSDVLDIEMHNANSDFLENVGFFVVIEPSKLISTAQIGLNLLVKKCKTNEDNNIVFCLCDKNCDGLVDAMSHTLMTSITEVSATSKHLGTVSYMCWESDKEYLHHRLLPNISRYLGMGTELSFAALKNQVSKTRWYGGEAFPVTDMRWIAKQYYYDLTKYASISTNQDAMDEHFITSSNFWSAQTERNCYTTVEDESYNMFEILRDFSTRTTDQGFINVISSEYLMKDYMSDNASIFETDAKAIPQIVADYTRSNRNTALRLILRLSTYPVEKSLLEKELSLLGIEVFDLKKQLWFEFYRCFADVDAVAKLSPDYKQAVCDVFGMPIKFGDVEMSHSIIDVNEGFNVKKGTMETLYSITDKVFISSCVSQLKSAGYVAEDEKGERYYLGSELRGHIYQKYLPGQFFTFGGKYYEMQYLTADGQVLVRRAADHINGRPEYRQLREYCIRGVRQSDKIGAQQNIAGMKIVKEYADITVDTPGYLRMDKYNDFASAKKVSFEGENNGIPQRKYFNKEILRIELPAYEDKLTDSIRYTITLLINELFRTLFAENQAYVCALTDCSFITDDSRINPLTYSLCSENCELNKNSIYIIEDSQLDLGLAVAVERNIERILSIVHDYLDWHFATLETSLNPPVEPESPIKFSDEPFVPEGVDPEKEGEPDGKKKKKGIFRRAIDKIKGWFKKKPKKEKEPVAEEETPTTEPVEETTEITAVDGETVEETPVVENEEETVDETQEIEPTETQADETVPEETEETTEVIPQDTEDTTVVPEEVSDNAVTDEADKQNMPSPEENAEPVEKQHTLAGERKPYYERYYTLFGYETEHSYLDLQGTLEYLTHMGFDVNGLKQAREGRNIAAFVEENFAPGKPDARYCDFCGCEIYGVEYETLADGRDRCINCSKTAIKTGEEFRKVFEDVKRNLESFFGIRINVGIKVEMVNAKKLHAYLGKSFIPTADQDGRVLGVAIKDKNGNFTLVVENGSPRMASMLTMAHELTHIWQYVNWDDKQIRKKYGDKLYLQVYEGMAKWVEIQYAYLINEPAVAKREEIITSYREDEYGYGFLRYRAAYPFSLGTVITKPTPFMNKETPLPLEYCSSFVVRMPTDGINEGDLQGETPEGSTTDAFKPEIPSPLKPIKGTIERDVNVKFRYAFTLLTPEEQNAYDVILNAINNFEPEITDIGAEITEEQVQKVVEYIKRDNPQIFWLRHGATYYFNPETRIVNRIEFTYCMGMDEATRRQMEIDDVIGEFIPQGYRTMSDYELTLRIYENIIKLVDYDSLELSSENVESPDKPDDIRSVYGALVNRKAVCAGYSKATQYLLNKLGLECLYVTSATHAWNIVKLEGDYYHLDTTWGDSTDTDKLKEQSQAVKYHCFCITDEDVMKLAEHTPDLVLTLPVCNATKCNYYHRHGLYFEKFEYINLREIMCEGVRNSQFDFTFKFSQAVTLREAKIQLVDEGRLREAIRYATLKTGVRIDTSFVYSINDDMLVLSFYLTEL